MKQHRQSTVAMALTTVAALVVTAWASVSVADDSTPPILDVPEQGLLFDVFRREKRNQDHQGMKIAIVQTRTDPEVTYGLIMLQTGDGVRGQGIICEPLVLISDGSRQCEQTLVGKKEIVRIDVVGSEFCEALRNDLEGKPNRRTPNNENPVASTSECSNTSCICYDVVHKTSGQTKSLVDPPNSGSGTGGHN